MGSVKGALTVNDVVSEAAGLDLLYKDGYRGLILVNCKGCK